MSEEASSSSSTKLQETVKNILEELSKKIIGHRRVTERLLMALVADGHVLLEGLPGLAKTTMVKALSQVIDLKFSRIQFTPDMLPADIVGTQIYDPRTTDFKVKQGPVFANLILADEINRAPAKVQSALLEAMQERQVTIGSQTFPLPKPFLVLATQNPIEQEGTYALPEAQVDRFLLKLKISYNTIEEEEQMLTRHLTGAPEVSLQKWIDGAEIEVMRKAALSLHMSSKVRRYLLDIVFKTREQRKEEALISVGVSPRGSLGLEMCSRIQALFAGRNFVTPQDVKDVALDVLRHRLVLSFSAEAQGMDADQILRNILERVPVP